MNENVKKVLKENLWYVATCGDEMNVTPVGFKDVAEDGTLEIAKWAGAFAKPQEMWEKEQCRNCDYLEER